MKNVYFNLNQMQHPCRRTMVGWTGTPGENREKIEPRECGLTHDHHGTISYAQPIHTPTQPWRESAVRVAKYVAMIFAVLTMSIANIGMAWGADFTPAQIVASGGTTASNIKVSSSYASVATGKKLCSSQTSVDAVSISNNANGNYNTAYVEIQATSGSISTLGLKIRGNADGTGAIVLVFWSGDAQSAFTSYSNSYNYIARNGSDCDGLVNITVPSNTKTVRIYKSIRVKDGSISGASGYTTVAAGNTLNIFGISATASGGSTKKIYLKNSMGWASAHVTLLGTSSYWDADKGSGSYDKTTYTMSYDSGKKLFYVDVPSASNDTYLCFTKDKQENYGNFWETEAVYVDGGYEFGEVVWVNTANTFTKNSTKYYGNSDLSGVAKEEYSADVYLAGDFNEWAKSEATAFVEDGTYTKEVTLDANTHYKFQVIDNAWFGNDGGIVHSQSDWEFTQSAGDCNFVTGPAGTYTFTYNRSTNQVSVAYPEVSHPNAAYTYFQKPGGWGSCYAHLFKGGTPMVPWHGAPMSATTTICETVYYYAAIVQSDFTTVIFNDGGSTQTADWTVSGSGNKHRTYGEADWQSFSTYTITFDGNGKTDGTMADVNGICPSGSTTLEANTFTKSGYDFSGWKTDVAVTANGSAVAKDGTVEDEAELTGITSNITLTAIWTPATYTITLAKGDHGAANQEATVAYNATSLTSITHVIANTGYELTGYYDGETKVLNADGTFAGTAVTGYITDSKWSKAADCELTAKWQAKSYTLTWNLNGGTVTAAGTGAAVDAIGTPSSSVAYGTAITAPTVTKANAVFDSWTPEFVSTMPAANTTYTAQWHDFVTLTYNANGGSGDAMAGTYNYGTVTLSTNTYTKDGYTFAGWATSQANADAGTVDYADGYSGYSLTANATLYAVWKQNFTITLNAMGGTSASYDGWTKDGDNYSKTVVTGTEVTLPTFTKASRTFKTWRDASTDADASSPYTVTGNITLNAIWNVTVETELYYWEGASGGATERGGTATHKNSSGAVDGNLRVNYSIIANGVTYYTISLNGKADWSTDYIEISLAENIKTGYKVKYTGYYTKDSNAKASPKMRTDGTDNKVIFIDGTDLPNIYSSGSPVERTFVVTTENVDYNKVQLTRNQTGSNTFITKLQILKVQEKEESDLHTITFDSDGGSSVATIYVDNGQVATAPTAPTKANYEFDGWYNGLSPYDWSSTVTGDLTLTAHWTPTYAITTLTPSNGTISASVARAKSGATVTLTATPSFRYVLDSWTITKEDGNDAGVSVTNNQFTMPAFAVKVNATFVADTRKQILYVTTAATGDDKIYAALNGVDDYNVIVEADGTQTPTDYDLIVFHESIGGAKAAATGNIAKTAISANVPILNMKSYFYSSGRWDWGTPNAGTSVTGATLNPAYCNIAEHPLFAGVTATDGFMTLFSSATAKAMQPLGTLTKTGYTLATTPNATSGNGCAIHEVTASQRGVTNAKYLMISIGSENNTYKLLTANGQRLITNAAAYLLDGSALWTPEDAYTVTTTLTNATSDAGDYVCPENIVGDDYVVTITPSAACALPATVTVTIAETEKTAGTDYTWDQETGTLTIPVTNITGNVAITAACTHFTVTYKSGDGTGDDVEDNTNATIQNVPGTFTAPDGKVFAGWKNESTNVIVKVGAAVTSDLTLVAVWVEEYTVTYKANGGTGEDVEEENALEIADNTFTAPSGKVFKYWNTATDASGTTYRPGDAYDEYTDVTLYAIWQSAPTDIFVWTKGDGAKITVDNTDLSVTSMGTLTTGTSIVARKLGTNDIDNNTSGYKLANNDVCVEIELTSGFKVGDTIKITGTGGGDGDRAFAIAPTTTINAVTDTILTEIIAGKAEHVYTAVVQSKQAGTKIRIFRMEGKTMYLKGITITRPTYKYLPSGTAEWPTSTGWQEGGASASAPTLSDIVIVDHNITVPDGVTAKAEHIILENNSTLTIAATGALILKEAFTREDGTAPTASDLVLESTSDGNATLIFDNSNSAAATVQMYSKATAEGGWTWQYIAAPAAVSALDNYYGGYLYKWVESSWAAVGRDATMELFAGYCVSYPTAGHTFAIEGALAPTTSKSITVPAGKSMVVGNSWTAPIQIGQFENADFGDLEKSVYFYNTGNDENNSGSQEIHANPTDDKVIYAAGTYISVPIHSAPYLGVSVISSLQGFFVKNNTGSETSLSLSYSKHVRPSGGNSVVNGAMHAPKRVADESDRPAVLKMKVSGSQYDDRLILLEREDFTSGYDAGWDGDKMGDVATSPRITTTREDGTADAVAALPDLEGTLINFRAASTDDQYTLYFDYETEDAEPLYLLDLTNNAYTRVETGSSYTFFTTDKADHKRFALTRYRAPQITTGVEDTSEDNGQGKAVKFIENDKLYILRNGVLYDGTGKKVIEN